MKLKTHGEDQVYYSNICIKIFGLLYTKSNRKGKTLKEFFGVQYSCLAPPTKRNHPNFNVNPFQKHILKTFKSMRDLGKFFPSYKVTIVSKVRYSKKSVVK